jgi:hypothetical protein
LLPATNPWFLQADGLDSFSVWLAVSVVAECGIEKSSLHSLGKVRYSCAARGFPAAQSFRGSALIE